MIDAQILRMLRCLQTGQPLRRADPDLCARVNQEIAKGHIYNRLGRRITEPLEGGLVNDTGTILYPIQRGIPQLLLDEMICLEPPDAAR